MSYQILTDPSGNYLVDPVTGNYLIVNVLLVPIPSVPLGEVIDYIFRFSSKYYATTDQTIGPYFSQFLAGLNPDVLMFDRSVNSTIPLGNYWVMVTKPTPIDQLLFNHPEIQLVNNRTQQILGNASVLLDVPFPDTKTLSIMISGIGQHTAAGLFGVGQTITGYITEDGSEFYVDEDGTATYVPE